MQTGTKTNDLNTPHALKGSCNENSVNSKVVLDDCARDFVRPSREIINDLPKSPNSEQKNDVSKSTVKSEQNLTDDRHNMSTISRYTTTSSPPVRVSNIFSS